MNSELGPKYLMDHPKPRKEITVDDRFHAMLRMLRKHLPPEHPVRVRRVDPEKYMNKAKVDGYCHLVNANKPKSKRYFLIEINKRQTWNAFVDHLMHEWAHALTWYVENKNDHGAQWSAAYGRIYRVLIAD